LGSFQAQFDLLWKNEGDVMEHAATEDDACTFRFITNKPFGVHNPDRE
jgi:hypothetical protein